MRTKNVGRCHCCFLNVMSSTFLTTSSLNPYHEKVKRRRKSEIEQDFLTQSTISERWLCALTWAVLLLSAIYSESFKMNNENPISAFHWGFQSFHLELLPFLNLLFRKRWSKAFLTYSHILTVWITVAVYHKSLSQHLWICLACGKGYQICSWKSGRGRGEMRYYDVLVKRSRLVLFCAVAWCRIIWLLMHFRFIMI